ncbi:MAG: pitrilysin family protein [Planctomycetota bacterium]|nr:pitrilysin family protein [Planctomycetota bacterium]
MSSLHPMTNAPLELLGTPGGVEVHLQQTARFKAVHLHWLLEAPLDTGRTARAILPDLLTRGTARFPDLAALSARCEELYNTDLLAGVTAHGTRQLLRFGVETIADEFSFDGPLYVRALDLLAEVLQKPPLVKGAFRPDHLDQERVNLARSIEALVDDKPLYAYRRLVEVMHEGTPFALHSWGEAEEARALTEGQVHEAWDFVRTEAPARLMIVGDITPEQALETAEQLSGVRARAVPASPTAAPGSPARAARVVEESQPLAQSRLAMGFRLPPTRLPGAACQLMSLVLGGGSHSRLFKRVREAESLAYGCGSSAMLDSATLIVQAGMDDAHVERVRELVLEELQRLGTEGVEEEEFDLSVRAQRRRLSVLRDSAGGSLGFRLAGLMSGRATTPEQALDQLEAVKPAEIAAVAAECTLDSTFVLHGNAE